MLKVNRSFIRGLFLAVVFCVSFYFRITGLGTDSFNGIEAFHVSAPLFSDFTLHGGPLSQIAIHVWKQIVPESEFWLRLLSIIFGMGTILLAYPAARCFLPPSASVVCVLLTGLSGTHIQISRTFSPDSIVCFLSVLYILCMIRFIKNVSCGILKVLFMAISIVLASSSSAGMIYLLITGCSVYAASRLYREVSFRFWLWYAFPAYIVGILIYIPAAILMRNPAVPLVSMEYPLIPLLSALCKPLFSAPLALALWLGLTICGLSGIFILKYSGRMVLFTIRSFAILIISFSLLILSLIPEYKSAIFSLSATPFVLFPGFCLLSGACVPLNKQKIQIIMALLLLTANIITIYTRPHQLPYRQLAEWIRPNLSAGDALFCFEDEAEYCLKAYGISCPNSVFMHRIPPPHHVGTILINNHGSLWVAASSRYSAADILDEFSPYYNLNESFIRSASGAFLCCHRFDLP
ncbi:MAG: hypothetical protein C4541_01680 [Candidatus Auribacter fodinae]|uniref:Uncharacterized protein n=1 Tax=Candidatus Auribacter fodinae TaxID=2093366 RepID=A0A3A4R5K5_9BACT|nr:MAG: hypothetical protein C4541_01680 [Candidatus Auribacter fodinae]